MLLDEKEQRFLDKRLQLIQLWKYVGSILLTILISFIMWLLYTKPLLSNPVFVLNQLKNDSIPKSTMTLITGMFPVVFLLCISIIFMIILLIYIALSNEKKYLAIIKKHINSSNQ